MGGRTKDSNNGPERNGRHHRNTPRTNPQKNGSTPGTRHNSGAGHNGGAGNNSGARHNGGAGRPFRGRGPASPSLTAQVSPLQPFTESDWLLIKRHFKFSPQQVRIVRLIIERDAGVETLMDLIRTSRGPRGAGKRSNKRAMETQINAIKRKMNKLQGYEPGTAAWDHRPIRSRAMIVHYVWVAFWGLRLGDQPL